MSGPTGRVTRGAGKDTAGFGGGRTDPPPADMLPLLRPCAPPPPPPPPPSARLHLPGSGGHRHCSVRRVPERRAVGGVAAPPGASQSPSPVTWVQVSATPPWRPRGSRAKVRLPPGAVLPAGLTLPAPPASAPRSWSLSTPGSPALLLICFFCPSS